MIEISIASVFYVAIQEHGLRGVVVPYVEGIVAGKATRLIDRNDDATMDVLVIHAERVTDGAGRPSIAIMFEVVDNNPLDSLFASFGYARHEASRTHWRHKLDAVDARPMSTAEVSVRVKCCLRDANAAFDRLRGASAQAPRLRGSGLDDPTERTTGGREWPGGKGSSTP